MATPHGTGGFSYFQDAHIGFVRAKRPKESEIQILNKTNKVNLASHQPGLSHPDTKICNSSD